MTKQKIQLFATGKDGERFEIDDLFFFEEQGIHDFSGEASYDFYKLEIWVDGIQVYSST